MYNFTSDYIQGYTKAIQDIQKIFTYIQPDLKHHKKNLNGKLALSLLQCILENRANVRDFTDFRGFIRYNPKIKGNFEWYEGTREDTRYLPY